MIGILSEDVRLYMKLLTANRYHALNDRTTNMLSRGEVDMSATTGITLGSESMAASKTVSDAEVDGCLVSKSKLRVP